MTDLQRLAIARKEGKEPFHITGNKLGFDLLSFWQWSASDDPLNLDQWRFYVLPAAALDERPRSQHSITLRSLEKVCSETITYAGLSKAVENSIGKSLV